jgi:hypothetical protein
LELRRCEDFLDAEPLQPGFIAAMKKLGMPVDLDRS